MQHEHATIGTNDLPCDPSSVLSTQHGHDAGNFLDIGRTTATGLGVLDELVAVDALADLHERRVLDPALDLALELVAVLVVHLAQDGARVDGVDRGPLRELARPRPRHGLERRLGAAVHGLLDEARRRRDGRQVDDAAGSVAREKGLRGLGEEQRAQDVDLVGRVKVVDRDLGQRVVGGDSGIVYQDINLELGTVLGKVLPGCINELLWTFRCAQVGSKSERLDIVLGLQIL